MRRLVSLRALEAGSLNHGECCVALSSAVLCQGAVLPSCCTRHPALGLPACLPAPCFLYLGSSGPLNCGEQETHLVWKLLHSVLFVNKYGAQFQPSLAGSSNI